MSKRFKQQLKHFENMLNYYWKVYLRPNALAKKATNFLASVAYNGRLLRPENLAHLIWQEGSEVREETILAIIGRYEALIRQKLLEGYCVMTPNCRMAPRVLGIWDEADSPFDPQRHRRSLDIYPSADMYKELDQVGVEVLGLRNNTRIGIARVTDAATGLDNGLITPGDDVVLEGERLKVTVDDPDAGVFFIAEADGTEYPVTRRLTQNFPTSVIARVPAGLPLGEYRVVIRTRFTSGGKCTQMELQEIRYTFPLQVREEDQS